MKRIFDVVANVLVFKFIIISFFLIPGSDKIIAGIDNEGFYYCDEFMGGGEDHMIFVVAGFLFFPFFVYFTVLNIRKIRSWGVALFLFITILVQGYFFNAWNDKVALRLNFLYGELMLRVWMIILCSIYLYLVFFVIEKLCKQNR